MALALADAEQRYEDWKSALCQILGDKVVQKIFQAHDVIKIDNTNTVRGCYITAITHIKMGDFCLSRKIEFSQSLVGVRITEQVVTGQLRTSMHVIPAVLSSQPNRLAHRAQHVFFCPLNMYELHPMAFVTKPSVTVRNGQTCLPVEPLGLCPEARPHELEFA
ncbi:hypothetical protein L210DRAFT_3508984 [Boletus edulis BED1]|uniref:Uncharacterized protein n=1 Tax=Boletus edulis BED1 TaxID=1328754 RepID=A0AAD4BFD9_BOLED|nr:hypothetical protein L210DRAFT_3508984 [Boletus edulis BED1]